MTGTAEAVCAFCKGKGSDPYGIMSWLSTCYVCHGKGTVTIPFPNVRCRYCGGTSSHKTFNCLVCGGTGVLPPLRVRRNAALTARGGPMKSPAAWRVCSAAAEEWFPMNLRSGCDELC